MKSRLNLCAGLRAEKEREKGEETKLDETALQTNRVSAQTNELLHVIVPFNPFFFYSLQVSFTSMFQSSQTFNCDTHASALAEACSWTSGQVSLPPFCLA